MKLIRGGLLFLSKVSFYDALHDAAVRHTDEGYAMSALGEDVAVIGKNIFSFILESIHRPMAWFPLAPPLRLYRQRQQRACFRAPNPCPLE